jgi:hypothetical protein
MKSTFIYLVENCFNDPNKVYVGKTININSRKKVHINKFGNNIIFTLIDSVNSCKSKDWKPLESYWIEQFRQWGFDMLNKNKGGNGSEYCSDLTKIKISKSNSKPRNNTKNMKKPKPKGFGKMISKLTKGKPKPKRSKEHGEKIGLSMCRPIIQYDLNLNLVKEWPSKKQAQYETNIKGIENVILGKAKTAGGFIWKRKNYEKKS